MRQEFKIGDVLESIAAWDRFEGNWLASLKEARQPSPDKEQLLNMRDIWLEAWLLGRTSKDDNGA